MDNNRTELFTEEEDREQTVGRSTEELENVLALPLGAVLDGRYRIVRVIRQGGFGITYEAVHMLSGERVAVKEYFCREICVRLSDTSSAVDPGNVRLPDTGILRLTETRPAKDPETVEPASENQSQASGSPVQITGRKGEVPGNGGQASAAGSVAVADPADLPRFEADRGRFLREARILREFAQEPAVVKVLDYFEENGTAYIVLEYLDAKTLRDEILDGGAWSMETVVHRFGPVMEVLARIHEAGVLHRDISPGNIMVMPDGTLKLIDFGAARELGSADRTHSAIFTRGYSAPEQRDEKGKLGSWTDVYGLCCVFWFCLTGQDPEDAQSRLLYDELERPSSSGGKISPAAEQVLMHGLELDRSLRIRNVETLRLALEKLYPSLTEAQRQEREAQKKKRFRAAAIAGCLILFAAACFAFVFRTRILFHFIDTQVVALDGSRMTPGEYADSSAKVRRRVEALTGKGRYLWKEEEDQHIIFEIPQATFGDRDPESFLKMMLTRPMIMRVYVELPEGSAQAGDHTGSGAGSHDETGSAEDTDRHAADGSAAAWSALTLREEKRKDGKKPGDTVSFSFDPDKSYRYLGIFRQEKTFLDVHESSEDHILIFQDEAAACLGGLLSTKGQHFLFCFDEFSPDGEWRNEFSLNSGYTLGDGKSIIISREEVSGGHFTPLPLALMKLIYGEAPSAAAFNVQCEREAHWEDPEAALLPGKNQTEADKIKPPYIQLQYQPGNSVRAVEADRYSSQILSIHAVIKNRLDSLGIPYAVGSDPSDSTMLFVRIPRETGICLEELEKLGKEIAGQVYLGSARTIKTGSFNGSSFSVQQTGENSWQILMSLREIDQDDAENILQTLSKQGAEEVFLYAGYRPVAAGDLQEAVRSLKERGTIAFTRWTFSEYRDMDEGSLSLGRFLTACLEQDPEKYYSLVRAQTREADGRSRFFMEGLPDPIDIDPGEKWAADQEPGDNIEVAYRSSSRTLTVTMYDYPLERPERCLAAAGDFLESARKKGVNPNEIYIFGYDKPKDMVSPLDSGQVSLNFEEDFEAGSMCLDYASISGFSIEDPKEAERVESLKTIYFQALRESPYWRRLLGEEALEKQEDFFFIPD